MIKVTMNLTDEDVGNIDYLHNAFNSRSKAQAVSVALSLTRFVVEQMHAPETQMLLRHSDGSIERIIMPELQNLARRRADSQQHARPDQPPAARDA